MPALAAYFSVLPNPVEYAPRKGRYALMQLV